MKCKRTNWQRFFESQMQDPEFRVRVEEELRALRVGAQIAALRQRRKLSQGHSGVCAPRPSVVRRHGSPLGWRCMSAPR
jgi:hypothetical protein